MSKSFPYSGAMPRKYHRQTNCKHPSLKIQSFSQSRIDDSRNARLSKLFVFSTCKILFYFLFSVECGYTSPNNHKVDTAYQKAGTEC